MSENQEFEMNREVNPNDSISSHEAQELHEENGSISSQAAQELREGKVTETIEEPPLHNLNNVGDSIDAQSYFLGEVPQPNLVDPFAFLPLNSDSMKGSVDNIEKLLFEVELLIEEEVNSIQKRQKRISFWEDRIEKNKTNLKKNEQKIKQNNIDVVYDKKNREYWNSRAEDVEIDYSHCEVSGRGQDWMWLIKKYGLKNADGTEIDANNVCVEELCNGESKNLSGEYRATALKYETSRKEKETENTHLFCENANIRNSNDMLRGYISSAYTNHVEPLQDGILLMKELGVKLKYLDQENQASYGDLRNWAEPFLSDFIRQNPRVPQEMVTNFRKLSSIPLPPEYC